jgi:hypothetical protein
VIHQGRVVSIKINRVLVGPCIKKWGGLLKFLIGLALSQSLPVRGFAKSLDGLLVVINQLLSQIRNEGVVGSNPISSTISSLFYTSALSLDLQLSFPSQCYLE